MNVALLDPEIPWNTGNAGRTCLAAGAALAIVGRPGFSLKDRDLRRAGLDYWQDLKPEFYPSLDEYLKAKAGLPVYFFSARGTKLYTDIRYSTRDCLIFGPESEGFDEDVRKRFAERMFRIPVTLPIRSLNLSTAVAVVLYEGVRQCTDAAR